MSRYQYVLPPHRVDYGVTIRIDQIKIDPDAQRTLNPKRAQAIADGLVEEAVGSVVISRRADGTMYAVDGMHRKRAFEIKGIPEITAEIHHGLSQMEEAVLFLIKNRESSKPNPHDEYKVGLTAGLPLFVDTQKVLDKHNLIVGSTTANSIGAVAGILRITENYGPEVLDRTLGVAQEAWGRTNSTWDGMLLGGIGMFLGRHGDVVKDKDLATKIAKAGLAQTWVGAVHAQASGGGLRNSGTGSRVSTCYRLIVNTWNKGKTKNKLAVAA
ncbi:DUF6551 family protein [Conexibacter woesei]|uniref:DUF6551 family protein n=1 Tax=Conexibacter woesei TaxID=191495 RepID=UPI00047BCF36|nr:DUF6551 family protein [Conexibacter woesei]